MKRLNHAFLITAYTDPEMLGALVDRLAHDRALVFIHWDRRSAVNIMEVLNDRFERPRVFLLKNCIRVNWGGRSHVEAIMKLIEEALKHADVGRLHLLSGQCYPVRPLSDLFDHFDSQPTQECLKAFPLPDGRWGRKGGLSRIITYQPCDVFNAKVLTVRRLLNTAALMQEALGIKRSYPSHLPKLYGGCTWWSLTRKCLVWVMGRHHNDTRFFDRLRNTFCSEEIFFPTMVMASPFARNLCESNLHYIDWSKRNGSQPAFLDLSDLDSILASGKYFARKFSTTVSGPLIDALLQSDV
jgi:hypothetical protein